MRTTQLQRLLQGEPAPMTWAILCQPSRDKLAGWHLVESTWNGGFYEHDSGMVVRCRGIEHAGSRWWHVVAGRPDERMWARDVRAVRKTFFPVNALVLQAHLPELLQLGEEIAGKVVHLWWAVDGGTGIPPMETWEQMPWLAEDKPPVSHD